MQQALGGVGACHPLRQLRQRLVRRGPLAVDQAVGQPLRTRPDRLERHRDQTHLGSRATLGAGVIENTPDNLRAWIRDPQAIKPGVLMPAFPSLSPSDLGALVDYLESLK